MTETIKFRPPDGIEPLDLERSRLKFDEVVALVSDAQAELLTRDKKFFLWLFGNSTYLTRLVKRHVAIIEACDRDAPETVFSRILEKLIADFAPIETKSDFQKYLRIAKGEVALLTALADLCDYWTPMQVTAYLSRFADLAVQLTIEFLLGEAFRRNKLVEKVSASQSGIIVLAMGKHGAGELNYSSDIDLIFFYEPNHIPLRGEIEQGKFFIDMARDMSAILQTPTEDGYVFRVDLRLRPDPGSTPVALPIPAALIYYEGHGQNWERAAFIKARAIAGDIARGEDFLAELAPFVWRRNLDFAAIEDVHSMKRQIHAVRGHAQVATAGHNLKLGRGGIREIEFFAQTQQLIAGGRDPSLRSRETLEVLRELAVKDWISQETADGLKESYCYMRRLEHRLQMRLDEQTHNLPRDQETLSQFANFAGYDSIEDLSSELTRHLQYVAREYSQLFEASESLAAGAGNLVFTGTDDDPETLETLAGMGFARPSDMSAIIRGWHTGRMRAMRSARAREMLTRLKPRLLRAIARTGQADDSLLSFDKFLSSLPAGIQLFSLFQANPHVLDLVVDIIGTAPRLAEWLSHNAGLLDVVLDSADPSALIDGAATQEDLATFLEQSGEGDIMTTLDHIRMFVHERQFILGNRILADPHDALACGQGFSTLADAAVQRVLDLSIKDVSRVHGVIEGAQMAVLAMGKYGSQEMTITSDLDLIIICDAPDFLALSTGEKPIDAETWFARTARRFLSGLTAPMAQGELYTVDTRLRPSGNSGPLVTKISGFANYQASEAWTWEHMALTRARVVAGDRILCEQIEEIVMQTLTKARDLSKTRADIAEMRDKLLTHKPSESHWDVKYGRGGLFEIEFFVQTMQLFHGAQCREVLTAHTDRALLALRDHGFLADADYEHLAQAWRVFSFLRQILSLCVGPKNTDELPISTENLLLRVANQPDIARLHLYLDELRAHVARQLDGLLTG